MLVTEISGVVSGLQPNDHTQFQSSLSLSAPYSDLNRVESGALVAAENTFSSAKEKRYTVLQLVSAFPVKPEGKAKTVKNALFTCTAIPLGIELTASGKEELTIRAADTYPAFDAEVYALDDETTAKVIHHIAPEGQSKNDSWRINIGMYGTNERVVVGLDAATLIRGNSAVICSRPRARTTITNTIIAALLRDTRAPLHIVYCDVNNQGTLSLANVLTNYDNAGILCLNDKFVPPSVFQAMKQSNDRQMHKRAVYDFLDMMLMPAVLEPRRHDFNYGVSQWLRTNKIGIYRANELTVDQFINDIRIDVLEGLEPDVMEYVTDLMNGIAATYAGERFGEKNIKDILEMIDEFSQDSKSHGTRRTLYDLKAEIQAVYETYSKDIPPVLRKTMTDVVNKLNDDSKSSLTVVQGQKTTDILRFIGPLVQTLVEERMRRLKIRVPVFFIFNNTDEYIARNGSAYREAGGDRFQDIIQTLLSNGRRHGLGFCLSLEQASSFDRSLSRRIQSYFIGALRFREDPSNVAQFLNVSEELLRPAVAYEDGRFLFASADSPYHRRVPLPVCVPKNTEVIHEFLDHLLAEQDKRRKDFQAQEEERRQRHAEHRQKPAYEQTSSSESESARRGGDELQFSDVDDLSIPPPDEPFVVAPAPQKAAPARQDDRRRDQQQRHDGGKDRRDGGRDRKEGGERRDEGRDRREGGERHDGGRDRKEGGERRDEGRDRKEGGERRDEGRDRREGGERRDEGRDRKEGGERRDEGRDRKEGGERRDEGRDRREGGERRDEGRDRKEGGERRDEGRDRKEGGERRDEGRDRREGGERRDNRDNKGRQDNRGRQQGRPDQRKPDRRQPEQPRREAQAPAQTNAEPSIPAAGIDQRDNYDSLTFQSTRYGGYEIDEPGFVSPVDDKPERSQQPTPEKTPDVRSKDDQIALIPHESTEESEAPRTKAKAKPAAKRPQAKGRKPSGGTKRGPKSKPSGSEE